MNSEKIYLYVSKDPNEGTILLGKPIIYQSEDGVIGLAECVMYMLQPTEKGMVPVSGYFPHPFMSSFVKKEALNKAVNYIDEDKFVYYAEEDINPDLLEMYKMEVRKRSGVDIAIVQGMPNIRPTIANFQEKR